MGRRKRKYDVDFRPMGLAIKASREAAHITREVGAEMVDISSRHLQSIELEGQYPGFELFIEIVKAFDVSVDAFIFPERQVEKTTVRRRLDKVLDCLDDHELMIIEATARAICEANRLKQSLQ